MRSLARLLIAWLLLSPSGLVGAAIEPSWASARTNAVAGSSTYERFESAERTATFTVGGDLALLAAQRSVQRNVQSSNRKESLRFEQDQTWQLLSTITAGNTVDINVAGNLSAQTGSTNAQGQFEAERMTKDGVLAGAARQQVSVSGASPGHSRVLGDLAAQGTSSL